MASSSGVKSLILALHAFKEALSKHFSLFYLKLTG